jgi:hypothetical protein
MVELAQMNAPFTQVFMAMTAKGAGASELPEAMDGDGPDRALPYTTE